LTTTWCPRHAGWCSGAARAPAPSSRRCCQRSEDGLDSCVASPNPRCALTLSLTLTLTIIFSPTPHPHPQPSPYPYLPPAHGGMRGHVIGPLLRPTAADPTPLSPLPCAGLPQRLTTLAGGARATRHATWHAGLAARSLPDAKGGAWLRPTVAEPPRVRDTPSARVGAHSVGRWRWRRRWRRWWVAARVSLDGLARAAAARHRELQARPHHRTRSLHLCTWHWPDLPLARGWPDKELHWLSASASGCQHSL
jgi:hypothetical protein